MHTLKDIKRRVRFLLDQYSENGELIVIDDTFYADGDLKFNDTVDYIQRKISVTSKKLIGRTSLVLRSPKVLAPKDDVKDEEFYIPEKSETYIKIPANSKTFSFVLTTEPGAKTKIEIYGFKKNMTNPQLSMYVFGVPSLLSLNLNSAVKYEDKYFEVVPDKAISLTAGYLPGSTSEELEAFVIKIIAYSNYPAVMSKFAAYENFFSSVDMIPEKGYTTARLPVDIIEMLSIEESIAGNPKPLKLTDIKGFEFSKQNNIITAPVEKCGIYNIVYYRYPKRITLESPEDTEVELDDYAVDALIFGVASIICPIENVAIIARMNSLFEETMRNIYNTDKTVRRIENKMFSPRKVKLNDL